MHYLSWFCAVRVSVHRLICVKHSSVCVWLAYEPTEHLFFFTNGLIRVVILQPHQNPHSAAQSVSIPYNLERLWVDRFPIFWLSQDAANKASCNHCQNAVQEPWGLLVASRSHFSDKDCVSVAYGGHFSGMSCRSDFPQVPFPKNFC